MTWLILAVVAAAAVVAVVAVRAERRPDPAPDRDIGAIDLPAVRGELVLRDVQHERQEQRVKRRRRAIERPLWRPDRGDQ